MTSDKGSLGDQNFLLLEKNDIRIAETEMTGLQHTWRVPRHLLLPLPERGSGGTVWPWTHLGMGTPLGRCLQTAVGPPKWRLEKD